LHFWRLWSLKVIPYIYFTQLLLQLYSVDMIQSSALLIHYQDPFFDPLIGYASLTLLHGCGRTLLSLEANPWTASSIPSSPISLLLWWWWCLCWANVALSTHYQDAFFDPLIGYASLTLLHGCGRTLLSLEANPWTASSIPSSPISLCLWWWWWWCVCWTRFDGSY